MTIFYFNDEMLTALNTNTITDSYELMEIAYRGKIKSVQFEVENFDLSAMNSGGTVSLNSQNSYIELTDNSKYYFTSVSVLNQDFEFFNNTYRTIGIDLFVEPYNGDGSYHEVYIRADDQIYVENDLVQMNAYYTTVPLVPSSGFYELSLTPVEWSGGSGSGGQLSGPGIYNGRVIMTAEADPTQVETLYNGQPLPTGSVVKVGSQKFFKLNGNSTAFTVIPQTPPVEWGWNSSADSDWAVLQGF